MIYITFHRRIDFITEFEGGLITQSHQQCAGKSEVRAVAPFMPAGYR